MSSHSLPYLLERSSIKRPELLRVRLSEFMEFHLEARYKIAGKVDARLEPVPISVAAYENDTWLPLIYEIKVRGLELKMA